VIFAGVFLGTQSFRTETAAAASFLHTTALTFEEDVR